MNIEKFKNISIKGRLAYGINCLETILIYYKCSLERWEWIVEKLWEFTSIEYLDDWYYEMAEFLPDSILENEKYNAEDFEYITEEQFYILLNLYKKEGNFVINQVFKLIFEIGTMDLYSKLENNAPNSIAFVEQIIEIMLKNNIKLPDSDKFIQYNFSYNGGWGKKFDGKINSLFLNDD